MSQDDTPEKDVELCNFCGGKIIDYGIEKDCENTDYSPLGKSGSCTRPKPNIMVDIRTQKEKDKDNQILALQSEVQKLRLELGVTPTC